MIQWQHVAFVLAQKGKYYELSFHVAILTFALNVLIEFQMDQMPDVRIVESQLQARCESECNL